MHSQHVAVYVYIFLIAFINWWINVCVNHLLKIVSIAHLFSVTLIKSVVTHDSISVVSELLTPSNKIHPSE